MLSSAQAPKCGAWVSDVIYAQTCREAEADKLDDLLNVSQTQGR